MTAAHCVAGTGSGYTFAPGYHDGIEPFGTWTVVRAYGAKSWISSQSPERDFAFLVVAPKEVNGRPEQIEAVTGANTLGRAPPDGTEVTIPGYAAGSDDDPITCTTRVYYRESFPALNRNP